MTILRTLVARDRSGVTVLPTDWRRWAAAYPDAARAPLLTDLTGPADPDRQPPSGGSRIMLEFFVDGHEAIDAKYAELVEAGYHGRRPPWTTSFDAYMCLVDDPDGNTVLVTAG